jgi:polyisoprenoid-binding protein YceI
MLRNLTFAGAVGLALGAAAPAFPQAEAAEPFAIDMAHTAIVFEVDHLGFSDTIGRFNEAEGVVSIDRENPANSEVEVTIQAASLDTNHAKRDEHLRGADFFNVAEYPTISFTSTDVEVTGENTAQVTGDFTMLGVTKPVTLDVTLNALKAHPLPQYKGVMTAGFSATGTIRRSDFGMGAYVPAVGDEVAIVLEVEAQKR